MYTVPTIVSRGLSLILVPLYTKVLSPGDYGSLDLFIVFTGVVNLTVALEVSQGVARYWASEEDTEARISYASTAFWFTLACYGVFSLAMLSLSSYVSPLVMGQSSMEGAFRVGLLYILLNGLFYLVQNQLRWELKSVDFAIASTVVTVASAAGSVLLGFVLRLGLSGFIAGMALGAAAGLAVGLWFLRLSIRLRFSVFRLREMLAFSSPLVVSGIAVWINLYADRMLINHFLTVEQVGFFGVGHRVSSVVGLTMVGFQGALTPLVYAHHKEAETPRRLADIFRWYVAVSLLMCVTVSVFAPDLLRLFTTPEFLPGARVVMFLAPSIILGTLYIFAPGIAIAGRTGYVVWVTVFGATINLLLGLMLVPQFGIVGAGVSTLVGYLCQFTAHVRISQRFYRIPFPWRTIGLAIVPAAVITGVLIASSGGGSGTGNLVFKAMGVVTAAGAVLFSGLVTTPELRYAAQLVSQSALRAIGRVSF